MATAKDNARGGAASARVVLALAVAGIVGLVGGGCAGTAPEARPDPTHRWISRTVESRAQYQHDNKACAAAAGESVAGDNLRRDAPTFVAYERCMGERGYELATY